MVTHTYIHTYIHAHTHKQGEISPLYSEEGETLKLANFTANPEKDVMVTYRGLVPPSEKLNFKYEYDGENGEHGMDGQAHMQPKARNGRPVCLYVLGMCVCKCMCLCVSMCRLHVHTQTCMHSCKCVYIYTGSYGYDSLQ
jgi:hypothetical protein